MTTRATRPLATSSRSTSSNASLDPGARAGIELTLETAKELRAALHRAIAAAEFEEAEVRGKRVVLNAPKGEEHRLNGRILSRSHAGFRFAASLLFRIVDANSHPFKIRPESGFLHVRVPE
jgi:hypothetical protein